MTTEEQSSSGKYTDWLKAKGASGEAHPEQAAKLIMGAVTEEGGNATDQKQAIGDMVDMAHPQDKVGKDE